jgi:hypothetical protein
MMRMTVVAAMVPKYNTPRPSKAVRASCEITVSASEGRAAMWWARTVMPRNSVPRIADIQSNVTPALWLRGSLKAVMPFEIASTPVRAVVPLENAWRIRKGVTTWAAWADSRAGGSTTAPKVPVR